MTEGKGGRIKEIEEDLATEGFREVGEKYLDAKLRTQETIHQEYTAKKAEEEVSHVTISPSIMIMGAVGQLFPHRLEVE